MCLSPKWIYKKGYRKETTYKGNEGDFYEIGTMAQCGICSECQALKSNNWVVRNYYEEKAHKEKCFITLTYAKNPVILVKKDLQDFLKRLRERIRKEEDKKIRVFYCGEYGSMNNRPHMHVIIYGWQDPNAKYLDINKKKQIVKQSGIIEECWGLGRTSYQEFNQREVPYISLYNTKRDIFKKAYLITRKNVNRLEKYILKNLDKKTKENALKELKKARIELEEEKTKYYGVKEFNGWSLALGWEEWEKEYDNAKTYTFNTYIEDKIFVTPSPWLKKKAKEGDYPCIQELLRREEEIDQETNEERAKFKTELKEGTKKKKDIIDWIDKKTVVEDL